MYILSRDRLNMDLDRASLDLMIRLLELEQDASSAKLLNEKDMNKIKEKIRRLCETVHNKHLDLENITVGSMLLLESLHSCGMLNKMELASIILHFTSPAKDSCCFISLLCIPDCTANSSNLKFPFSKVFSRIKLGCSSAVWVCLSLLRVASYREQLHTSNTK